MSNSEKQFTTEIFTYLEVFKLLHNIKTLEPCIYKNMFNIELSAENFCY